MQILIAEDDANLRAGLDALLRGEGYQCTLTENGSEALAAFKRQKPDFCIFDVMMPELNGFDLCRQIRQLDEQVPIILLTAKGDEVDRVVGLELGADDYIAKPFGTRELLARVKAITRRAKAAAGPDTVNQPQASFTMHGITVDPKTLRAQSGEKTIELTLREIAVLTMLHREAGRVVPRLELFEECWGRRYMTNSRALDQFISQLRQKIEPDPSNPVIIRTVHGVGYRYEE